MTQEERNRLALAAFGGAKLSGIGALLCAYQRHPHLGIFLFAVAITMLVVSITLCLTNLKIQAQEEWHNVE